MHKVTVGVFGLRDLPQSMESLAHVDDKMSVAKYLLGHSPRNKWLIDNAVDFILESKDSYPYNEPSDVGHWFIDTSVCTLRAVLDEKKMIEFKLRFGE